VFPQVARLGIARLDKVFGLKVVVYPSAKDSEPSVKQRADDLNRAFSDTNIKAIISTIGGEESIRILPYLDAKVIARNKKWFLGYSDCTSIHLFLFNLGIPSIYGGALMCQFATSGKSMLEFTERSIRAALFQGEERVEMFSSPKLLLDYNNWALGNRESLALPDMVDHDGWSWKGWAPGQKVQKARVFIGCLSTLIDHFIVKKYLPPFEVLNGCVFCVETSESMPCAGTVYGFFQALGVLGILHKFQAVCVGIPKTRFLGQKPGQGEEQFKLEQKEAILRAMRRFAPKLPLIFDLEFGHTDPQFMIPSGGHVDIDSDRKSIHFYYH